MSAPTVVPRRMVVVAFDQVPGARAFGCYPENYDEAERQLLPEDVRPPDYAAYALSFAERDIGDLLEPLEPLLPRPPCRLPRFE
jgi:hypothetical protein